MDSKKTDYELTTNDELDRWELPHRVHRGRAG